MLYTGAVLEKASVICVSFPIWRKAAQSLTCGQRMWSSWLNKIQGNKYRELRNKQIHTNTQESSHWREKHASWSFSWGTCLFLLRATGETALRSNVPSFRSIKGQNHHSAGTRKISPERNNYNQTWTTQYAHDVVPSWVALLGWVGERANSLWLNRQKKVPWALPTYPGMQPTEWSACHTGCERYLGVGRTTATLRRKGKKHLKEFKDRPGVALAKVKRVRNMSLGWGGAGSERSRSPGHVCRGSSRAIRNLR